MIRNATHLKWFVAALFATQVFLTPALAEEAELEALFEGLRSGDAAAAEQIEGRIYDIWSKSGSPSMDLLLDRGRNALTEGDAKRAVEHFSALIDHAPTFAEGYNGRATAFFQDGKYGLAMADIQQTLNLNPRHFGALTGLALILEQVGKPADALAAWREVEKLHPNHEGLAEALNRLERQVEGAEL